MALVQRERFLARSHPPPPEFEELFEDELEFELPDEFELELEFEFEELFDDEFEFELLDEFELELLEEFELELDELLPATMIDPSLLLVDAVDERSPSGIAAGYSLACAAVLASAAIPATRADLSFQCLVMVVTPFSDRAGSCGPAE